MSTDCPFCGEEFVANAIRAHIRDAHGEGGGGGGAQQNQARRANTPRTAQLVAMGYTAAQAKRAFKRTSTVAGAIEWLAAAPPPSSAAGAGVTSGAD